MKNIQLIQLSSVTKKQNNKKKYMMKYLQMGKDYFIKKNGKQDNKLNKVQYISGQIPARLRQALYLIQQEEIDIQDTQVYNNYFKSYPNHHLSTYLLDKYKMMVSQETVASKYVLPGGKQSLVPATDQQLQYKALIFKQAIQQYDEGFTKIDQPIISMSVINFHHERGVEMQYRYPQNKAVQSLDYMVLYHAIPDSSHHQQDNYNFFNFQAEYKGKKRMFFGISYFKNINVSYETKQNNVNLPRSYIQKAITILSALPLFGYLKVKLSVTTQVFFQNITNFSVIEQIYKDITKHFLQGWPNTPITDLYIGSDLKSIISLFSANQFFQIWKAILYQKRIVVYGRSSSAVSSFILSILSLFPGLLTFGIYSKPIARYMQALRQLALPLRFFSSQNLLCLSFHLQDFHQLDKYKENEKGHFLLGTTNKLFIHSNDFGIQMVINLQNCTIQKRSPRRPWQPPSEKQNIFINDLQKIATRQKNLDYLSSEDCIRNNFDSFLKGALIQIIRGIRSFKQFIKQKNQFSLQAKSSHQKQSHRKFFPSSFPQSTKKMIFTELFFQKSFNYFIQFKNQNFPDIFKERIMPSLYINNYDYFLKLNKEQFISYNWIQKKLTFGIGKNIKNFEGKQIKFKGAKDQQGNQLTKIIYIGKIQNGKYEVSGCYLDEFERYQGQYHKGIRQGYGKLITGNQRYIGDFVQGVYQGKGQLTVGNDLYIGDFKNGVINGYGQMHVSFQFSGLWQNNFPIISMDEQQYIKQIQKNKNSEFKSPSQTPKFQQLQKNNKPSNKIQQPKKLFKQKLQQIKIEEATKQQKSVGQSIKQKQIQQNAYKNLQKPKYPLKDVQISFEQANKMAIQGQIQQKYKSQRFQETLNKQEVKQKQNIIQAKKLQQKQETNL